MEKFNQIAKIGQGNFGDVLLVKNKADQKLYALKRVSNPQNHDLCDDTEKRYDNEVKLLKLINHPNIIKYYDSFFSNYQLFILMEYADSGDLQKIIDNARIQNKYIQEDQVLQIFAQICLAIKYLKKNNILHRDIKGQNIFLTKTGLVKLGDFGISKQLSNSDDLANTQLGTPYYFSPEICLQEPYDHKSDMWMLGCLLHELCSLVKPFNGSSLHELINNILHKKHNQIPNHYSFIIHQIIENLLQKDQKNRLSIDDLLQQKIIKKEIYALTQKYTDEYKDINLEDIFKGQNIFEFNTIPLIKLKSLEPKKEDFNNQQNYSNNQKKCNKAWDSYNIRNCVTTRNFSRMDPNQKLTPNQGNQNSFIENSASLISTNSSLKREKLAQNNIHYIIQQVKKSQSPYKTPVKSDQQKQTQINNDYFLFQSSHNSGRSTIVQQNTQNLVNKNSLQTTRDDIEDEYGVKQQNTQLYFQKNKTKNQSQTQQNIKITPKISYKRDIQINTNIYETCVDTSNISSLKAASTRPESILSINQQNQQTSTTNDKQNAFMFSQIFNMNASPSVNRCILFTGFLKQRLGIIKLNQMWQWLQTVNEPLKALETNKLKVCQILGEENLDCVKIFEYIIRNSTIPISTKIQSLTNFDNLLQDCQKQINRPKTSSSLQFNTSLITSQNQRPNTHRITAVFPKNNNQLNYKSNSGKDSIPAQKINQK